jgi:chitin synthase
MNLISDCSAFLLAFCKLYIALLVVVTIVSLGNRPQGSKWTYTLAIVLFGLCNIITLYCAAYTVYLASPKSLEEWKDLPYLVQHDATVRDIVISLAATYGLYFVASFMHFEPWHMFTSFFQYMFLLPSCECHLDPLLFCMLIISLQTLTF